MKLTYIISFLILLSFSLTSAFDFPHTVVTISYSGNYTNLSQLLDTNIPTPTDNHVLSWDSATSKWIDVAPSAVGDTNETTRFDILTGTNCGAGEYAYGVDATGLVECRADAGNASWNESYADTLYAAAGSGNSSWNETYADTLYIEVGEEGNLNVNSSDYWDDMDTINATQMEDNDGTLNILITWLSTAIDNWLSGKDTDDLTEGSTNLYDNSTWNETYADTLYAATGAGNSSFNQSLTYELYVNITGDSMTGNLTNSEWFNGQFNWTTTDEWSSFDGTTFDFNESNLETTYFLADAIQVVTGTGAGDLADIQTYNRTTYNVTESNSDFELRVNFTGITEFTTLLIRHKSSVVADHSAAIQIWDYGDSTWEGY